MADTTETETTPETTTTTETGAATATKTRKARTPSTHRLARHLSESDDLDTEAVFAIVKEALEQGRGVLVELDTPDGLEEGASKASIQNKVKTSVRKHSIKASPYVNQGRLTVVSYTEPKEPKLVEKQVATVTDVEW